MTLLYIGQKKIVTLHRRLDTGVTLLESKEQSACANYYHRIHIEL